MSDRTLRQRVRVGLADGTLRREFHASGVTYGALTDRCAVCDERRRRCVTALARDVRIP